MQPADMGMILLRIIAVGIGIFIVVGTVISAVKAFILPRAVNVWLTRFVFHGVGIIFQLRAKRAKTYEERDSIMAMFAPLSLFLLPIFLLSLILIGYTFIFWALEPQPLTHALRLSGSSLLTLGYESGNETSYELIEFSEATLGLILVALLIAYLPTIYAAFSKRETAVALIETRAGTPPSALEFIVRSYRTGDLEDLGEVWESWRVWFAELQESHTSLAPLSFFRSTQPDISWITAGGTVLDAAALMLSTVDVPRDAGAAYCIRSGYIAFQNIATFFDLTFNATPAPGDPISVTREEFEEVYDQLAARNVPVVADRDQAWRDFAGWRVNYDTVLLQLAAITYAPYAPWTSDRSALLPQSIRGRG
ncbi:MAG: hypothetical protein IAF02_00345 [Anaerolineae bacterium]|nr:hypothetical protein [Anaerolineae bacterium]